ncbi:hypothetical protein KM295_11970 [Natronomonas sp. F2-12]|jgi:hypothetical protein|uniref:Uncharacterized protein n=1 Tax=Natronomonas aquatica TaxID=2841590 RepID=A0A9R1D6D9_9EURY|nr:hypothetical protein [Natronomonas aquatica]MCQ4334181.1 hypothetical protein [Natronomonas aquatica]
MDMNEIGGATLVAGFLTVLLVLYRDPVYGLDAATDGVASVVYFAVLPVTGLLAGVYAYTDGPYSVVPLFFLGSYLGVFGLALTLGSVLGPNPIGLFVGVGIVLLSLSLVALVASVLRSTASVRLDFLESPSR